MVVVLELIKLEAGEPVEHLGEWNFHSSPQTGDEVELIMSGRVDTYAVVGYRHTGIRPESVASMPNTFNPDNRKPKLFVEFKTVSFDPPVE